MPGDRDFAIALHVDYPGKFVNLVVDVGPGAGPPQPGVATRNFRSGSAARRLPATK